MDLTPEQEKLIKKVDELLGSGASGRIIILGGAAGCGKSTAISILAEEIYGAGKTMMLLAPTGKAALRLRELSGLDTKTIHSWIYKTSEDPETGELTFVRKSSDQIDRPSSKLVVIDECSMLTSKLFSDLYAVCVELGLNLLLVGDYFQLPPVAEDGFSVFRQDFPAYAKIWLTKVMRQAEDSYIIRAATAIRNQDWAKAFKELKIVKLEEFVDKAAEIYDTGSVCCFTNATRTRLNKQIRQKIFNTDSALVEGERLCVSKNNYELNRFNGEILDVSGIEKLNRFPHAVKDGVNNQLIDYYVATNDKKFIVADKYLMNEHKVKDFNIKLAAMEIAKAKDNVRKYDGPLPYLYAQYGYCLTAHRMQGSQWDKVLVMVENSVMNDYRWVYTSFTRSVKELYVCFG